MKRTIAWAAAVALLTTTWAVPVSAAVAKSKPKPNIVQVASSALEFSTLVSLVKKAGLASALAKLGPYTVFAPTNSAFAALAKKNPKLFAKVATNKKLLTQVLLYHVAEGKLLAKQVVKRSSITTLQGQRVHVTVRGKSVRINQAKVITADITASNGVIHAINAVLLPKI